jgi:[ribosomal protein S18]-alanine N-acetyltransferase
MPNDLIIEPALPGEFVWSARLMASNDPWKRLGRTFDTSLGRLYRAGSTLYIARLGGEPAGFLLLDTYGVAGSPYIASVATAEGMRGKGIGSAMVDFAERLFPHARYIFLCVSSFNPDARRLYERKGYTLVAELKDYAIDGADEHLMSKRLNG